MAKNEVLRETLAKVCTTKSERFPLERIRGDREIHREYIRRFQEGDRDAAKALSQVNHPFIHKNALKFGRRHLEDYDDLMQEGRMGALDGYARFDLNRDVSPLTYVHFWILHRIRNFLSRRGSLVPSKVRDFKFGERKIMLFSEMKSVQKEEAEYTFEEALVFDGPSAEDIFLDEDLAAYLPEIVEIIKPLLGSRDTKILTERHLGEEDESTSYQEIAETQGITRQAIMHRIKAALARVHKAVPIEGQAFDEWLEDVVKWSLKQRCSKEK